MASPGKMRFLKRKSHFRRKRIMRRRNRYSGQDFHRSRMKLHESLLEKEGRKGLRSKLDDMSFNMIDTSEKNGKNFNRRGGRNG